MMGYGFTRRLGRTVPGALGTSRRAWCLLLSILLVVPLTAAAQDPIAILERMAEASRQLNYDGVFVYRRADTSESMRLIHRSAMEGEAERLVSLSGTPREVIRDALGVRCFLPLTGEMSLSRDFARPLMPTEITRPWSRLSEYYTFNVLGEDRVAGRPARVVAVAPRSDDRYGYRFWTDRDTGLLLRSELVNREGEALEQVEFVSLQLPTRIDDALLQPTPGLVAGRDGAGGADDRPTGTTEYRDLADVPWRADWLPAGFRLERAERLADGHHRSPFHVMAFTDGLAVLSVFVEARGDAPSTPVGYAVLGATVAYTTQSGEHTVTVVGEAPPLTVRRLAEGMKPTH